MTRNKIKYDIGFQKMMIKLCEALKDRSFSLCQEHYEKLIREFTETAMAITRYANGRENEFCNKVIKLFDMFPTVIGNLN